MAEVLDAIVSEDYSGEGRELALARLQKWELQVGLASGTRKWDPQMGPASGTQIA